jgi:hypothetical protein
MDPLNSRTIELLSGAEGVLASRRAVIGLDGFVDKILRVVRSKDDDEVSFITSIPMLTERIGRAAGKSTALEMRVQQVKLGGNGPIMANALCSFGLDLTYIGSVGGSAGGVDAVFQPMAERSRVIPVCEVARTDALEFDDGKLMLQEMESLDRLDFEALLAAVGGEAELRSLFDAANFVALNHWSSLPHMSAIWARLQADICPTLTDTKRDLFIDLADPEKHVDENVGEALELIGGFERWYNVILGMNEKESEQIARVLGCQATAGDRREAVHQRTVNVQKALQISCVAIHPVEFAAAASADGSACIDGAYTPKPLISTGAGDHFNAGFCLGRILDGDLEQALKVGVSTSGFYVRTAKSPTVADLIGFLGE